MESILSACLSAPDSKNTNIAWRQIYFRHHMDPMYSASPARSAWCLVSFFAARSDLLPSGETPVHQKTTGGLRFSLSSKVLTKLKKTWGKRGCCKNGGFNTSQTILVSKLSLHYSSIIYTITTCIYRSYGAFPNWVPLIIHFYIDFQKIK